MKNLSSNRIITIGFSLILVLLAGLISIWLWHIDRSKTLLNNAVREHRESNQISLMRDAVQERVLLLHTMFLTEDPFHTDSQYQRFSQLARQFIRARDELLDMELNPRERAIWERIKRLVSTGQFSQQRVFDLIQEDKRDLARRVLREEVEPNQRELILLLTQLLSVPLNYAHQATETSYKDSALAFSVVSLFGTGVFLLGIFIATYVARSSAKTELELTRVGHQAQLANRQKTLFIANMSHEIRTPLTSIIGFAAALKHDRLRGTERTDALDKIERNGKHLLHIINDILDTAKIESEKITLEKTIFDLIELLRETVGIVSVQAQVKHITLNSEFSPSLPKFVVGDPVRLKQILINLLANAIKFTAVGSVEFNCTYQDEQFIFRVKDTGIGMNESELSKIFQPFSQVDASTTRKFGGSGLGLSISQRLAELMGGTIQVQSTKGKGSTFTLTLNIELADRLNESPATAMTENVKSLAASAIEGRILAAEDNPDIQELIKVLLRNSRIKLTVANNGQEAVEKALTDSPDIVLMDMQMPVMDGMEATQLLRGAGFTKPIIALTANIRQDDIARYRDIGVTDHIGKPIDQNQLYLVLSKYAAQIEPAPELKDLPEYENLRRSFNKNLPELVKRYQHAFENQDSTEIASAAHAIKGVTAIFGYNEISGAAAEIETHAKKGNVIELQQRHEPFIKLLTEVRPA